MSIEPPSANFQSQQILVELPHSKEEKKGILKEREMAN